MDALWDRLFEVADDEDLPERLDAYFALVRGDTRADDGDRAREAYMASSVRATLAVPGDPTVVVVTGGFHQPALRGLVGAVGDGTTDKGAMGHGVMDDEAAANGLVRAVATRLRSRHHPLSTADLIAARALTRGLTALRGHARPARTDVLDGMAGTLIGEDLDQPLPWTTRGTLAPGAHSVVVEMIAASTGDRVCALHPDTPRPRSSPMSPGVAATVTTATTIRRTGQPSRTRPRPPGPTPAYACTPQPISPPTSATDPPGHA